MRSPPAPLCTWELGADWMDAGTLARTRHCAPNAWLTHQAPAPLPAASPPPPRHLDRAAAEALLLARAQAQGLQNPTEQAMFLAQMAHESAGFTRLREDLRGYSAIRLHTLFPLRIRSLAEAKALLAQGSPAVAERLYGNRLGNRNAGDGYRYIGRGYIQLTGRENYEKAGAALGLNLLDQPELAEDPEHAARIALWFWMSRPKLRQLAAQADVAGTTAIVNGGHIGLADRQRLFQHYRRQLGLSSAPPPPPPPPPPPAQP